MRGYLQDQFLQKWSSRISEEEDFSSHKVYKDVYNLKNMYMIAGLI